MSETEKLFENASKLRFRYQSSIGTLCTEDLWDMDLKDLDKIAKALNKEVKDSGEESFIKAKTVANKTVEAKFEIVKTIIDRKLAEQEKRAKAVEVEAKRSYLKELIGKKENSEMESKSAEELRKELEELEK